MLKYRASQIMENAELTSLVKIIGLKYTKKYETEADIKTLRYGKIMIMADQDVVSIQDKLEIG